MYTSTHFLIRCQLPATSYSTKPALAVDQAAVVNRLLLTGELLQYAVAEDEGQWWAIIPAQTEWQARQLAATLPWCDSEAVKVIELSFFACNEAQGFSLN
jgi:hypothetical protein